VRRWGHVPEARGVQRRGRDHARPCSSRQTHSPSVHSPNSCKTGAAKPYTAGTPNSVPLLKLRRKSVYFPPNFGCPDTPKMHQISRICNYIFKKNFPRVIYPRTLNLPRLLAPLRLSRTVPLFQRFRGRCCETAQKSSVFSLRGKL